MRIKLESDFTDWYDDMFFPDGDLVWKRNQSDNFSPAKMFSHLEQAKIPVPMHGLAGQVAPSLIELMKLEIGIESEETIVTAAAVTDTNVEAAKKENLERQLDVLAKQTQMAMFRDHTRVVVYGENGSEMMDAREAMVKHPESYCSQYIPSRLDGGSFSQTLLHIGTTAFIIESTSESWRSTENAQTAVTNRFPMIPTFNVPSPIFSISFVPSGERFLAVNFNLAPRLELVQQYIKKDQIYIAVQEYLTPNRTN